MIAFSLSCHIELKRRDSIQFWKERAILTIVRVSRRTSCKEIFKVQTTFISTYFSTITTVSTSLLEAQIINLNLEALKNSSRITVSIHLVEYSHVFIKLIRFHASILI